MGLSVYYLHIHTLEMSQTFEYDNKQFLYEWKYSSDSRKTPELIKKCDEFIKNKLYYNDCPAFSSYLESKLILDYDCYAISQEAKTFLKSIKKYMDRKIYKKFRRTFNILMKFLRFMYITTSFNIDGFHPDNKFTDGYGFIHYVLWKEISQHNNKTYSKTAFNNLVFSFFHHRDLWSELEQFISTKVSTLYESWEYLRKYMTAPERSLFWKHRMITNTCKLFIRRVSRFSESLQAKQTNPRFGVMVIDEITWDISWPFLFFFHDKK